MLLSGNIDKNRYGRAPWPIWDVLRSLGQADGGLIFKASSRARSREEAKAWRGEEPVQYKGVSLRRANSCESKNDFMRSVVAGSSVLHWLASVRRPRDFFVRVAMFCRAGLVNCGKFCGKRLHSELGVVTQKSGRMDRAKVCFPSQAIEWVFSDVVPRRGKLGGRILVVLREVLKRRQTFGELMRCAVLVRLG